MPDSRALSKPSDQFQSIHTPVSLLPPEDEEAVLKDTLDTLLGVDIIRVVKDRGDKPVYCMYTEQGAITLGTIGHVTSRKGCSDRIAEVTGVVVPVVSPEVWGRYAQAILRLCEDVGAGDPVQEETRSWLDGYLIECYAQVKEEWEKAALRGGPFLKGGLVHISLKHFRKWLRKKPGKRPGPPQLKERMLRVKAERKDVYMMKDEGGRTTRSVWILPDTFQPPQRDGEEPGGDTEEELG